VAAGHFDPELHVYTLGKRRVPSTTQALAVAGIAPDYRRVDPLVLRRKRALGRALHLCLRLIAERDIDPASVDPELEPYLDAHQLFVKDRGFKMLSVEEPTFAELAGLPYGMTPDVTGLIRGQPWLIDYKMIEGQPQESWGVQTSAYVNGLPVLMIPPFKYRRASLQLMSSGKYRFKEWDDPGDLEEYRAALFLTWRRINRGYDLWKELT
jgi:hypothetical protein